MKMIDKKSELKPCPFCGCSASFNIITSGEEFQISCDNSRCGAEPVIYTDDKSLAISLWNARAPVSRAQLEWVVRRAVEMAREFVRISPRKNHFQWIDKYTPDEILAELIKEMVG